MAYSPTDWADGITPVDEAHLDKIEQGIVTADANATAAQAALPAKENKSEKGAVNGYAPLDGTSKVPAANLPPGGADLSFDGDWAAGTYQDGDVVVKDGVTFMCVGGPTTVAPDASLWGSVIPGGPVVPAIQNGKWIKGVGGAMVWSDVVSLGGGNASAANTDLAAPTAPVFEFQVTSGGGSVRSIGSWPSPGSARVIVHNWVGSTPFTLIAGAGGLPGGQTALGLRDNANLVLGLGESVEFAWDGSWREVSRNLKTVSGTELAYGEHTGWVTVSGTTSGAAQDASVTVNPVCDGKPILVEYYVCAARPAAVAAGSIYIGLWQDGALIGVVAQIITPAAGLADQPVYAARRLTPAAGTHSYITRAWQQNGGGTLFAGAGGTDFSPGFIRVTKV